MRDFVVCLLLGALATALVWHVVATLGALFAGGPRLHTGLKYCLE